MNDIERLQKAIDQKNETIKFLNEIVHNQVVANQSAWIEWKHGEGANAAMRWIENGLLGPGHIPDENAEWGKEAQAWYDANIANPLPKCFCGRPSNIIWMGKGACCNWHMAEIQNKA